MKLGVVIDDKPAFIGELLGDWSKRYDTHVFTHRDIRLPALEGRINRWRFASALRRFLSANDIVFFEWAGPSLIAASRLPRKAKLVVRLMSYELFDFAPRVHWDAIDRIIVLSRAMERRLCERHPSVAKRTTRIWLGRSLETFQPRPRQFAGVLGMLGNLIPIKRVYEVILAVYELRRNGHHFVLRLGGSPGRGADEERYYVAMRRLVSHLQLQDQVEFEGEIADAAAFLSRIDIFISNSYWESQHMALGEAMATGCYCLAHRWEGAEEIVPPENLYASEAELQQKIVEYCSQPDEEKRRRQARMRAIACENFDIEHTKRKIRAVFESLVEC